MYGAQKVVRSPAGISASEVLTSIRAACFPVLWREGEACSCLKHQSRARLDSKGTHQQGDRLLCSQSRVRTFLVPCRPSQAQACWALLRLLALVQQTCT